MSQFYANYFLKEKMQAKNKSSLFGLCQNRHYSPYDDLRAQHLIWRSRSLSNVNRGSIKSVLQFAKTSLEDLSRICSPISLKNGDLNRNRYRASYSPEIISLETESNSVITNISSCEERDQSDNAYSPEEEKLVARPNNFIVSDELIAKLETTTNDIRQKIQKPRNVAELKKAEAEKLIIEAKLRLEARLYQRQNIEDEIKARLRLEGLVIPEPKKDEDFVDLTSEQIDTIQRSLEVSGQHVLVEKFNIIIRRKDIASLCAVNWLNDEVINFFFNLIMERSGKNGLPSVYAFNTFFYPRLCQGGHASLKRWTKKVDIFSHDMILIPVHLGIHWCLAVIDFRKRAISYYDSLGGDNTDCIMSLRKYLQAESLDKKKVVLDLDDWDDIVKDDIPFQNNGSDCGVFTCKFADFVSRDKPISFSQQHMPYFRQRIIYEILSAKL